MVKRGDGRLVPCVPDEDGYLVCLVDGEVLGRVGLDEHFTIDTEAKADWALELRSEIEGELAGIDARIKAVTEQLSRLRKQKLARLSFWDFKFRSQIIGFARTWLENRKERTMQLTWGKVAFRKTAGRTEIMDMPKAVAFVRAWAPDAVKVVETVNQEAIKEARENAVAANFAGVPPDLPFLASSGPGESITISTGITKER